MRAYFFLVFFLVVLTNLAVRATRWTQKDCATVQAA